MAYGVYTLEGSIYVVDFCRKPRGSFPRTAVESLFSRVWDEIKRKLWYLYL